MIKAIEEASGIVRRQDSVLHIEIRPQAVMLALLQLFDRLFLMPGAHMIEFSLKAVFCLTLPGRLCIF